MIFSWLNNLTSNIINDKLHFEPFQDYNDLLRIWNAWLNPKSVLSNLFIISAEALEHILYACLAYLLLCLGIYKLTFLASARHNNSSSNEITQSNQKNICRGVFWNFKNVHLSETQKFGRVLFVTSHPDDECMFFGPLILSLTQCKNCQVYILCLSNGNYEKKADLRREELWRSCEALGIDSSNIIMMNATNLPDDPNVEWKTDAVANLILKTVESFEIQALVTFDRDGVSQHPNHCAIYFAAASLCLTNLLPEYCKFYTLDSINLFRKYLSLFDLICTCCMSSNWCILSWKQASIIRNAMKEHKSQMKWFRWLYIYFSRYMFINSMREINLSDVELEMQIGNEN